MENLFHCFVSYLTLAEAGGVDNQEYDKCYDCLTSPPSSIFNSEITVFKHVHHAVNNVDKLLVKSREEYRMLFTNHTWTSSEKSKGRDTDVGQPYKKSAKKHHSDISALVDKNEMNDQFIRNLNKHLSASKKENFIAL